ncbi:hypothetical protein [Endozoicomonas lisbonensis]|uniref:Uncharacterized protein n=1 Tax=Endozoicomonas lisbonensis TaxID=3120522 RepID=A0ABV2SP37_9GAMM
MYELYLKTRRSNILNNINLAGCVLMGLYTSLAVVGIAKQDITDVTEIGGQLIMGAFYLLATVGFFMAFQERIKARQNLKKTLEELPSFARPSKKVKKAKDN